MNNFSHLLFEKQGQVATLVINRPETLNALCSRVLEDAFKKESEYLAQCFEHPDRTEGLAAFLEKRLPVFDKD